MKRIQMQRLRLAAGFVALSLAACSATGTNPDKASQANTAANVLTFSVGTANIYGTATGLNIYAAYRQPAGATNPGASGALVTEPTLSGPLAGHLPAAGSASNADPTSTAPTGPGPNDTSSLSFTAQGGTSVTTWGTSGGVTGLGIEPFNFNNQGGNPATYVPYTVPMFYPASGAYTAYPAWGGPPGFDPNGDGMGVRDGNPVPGGVLGVSEGLDILYGVTPVAASPYTLSLTIPATSTTPTTASGTATIASVVTLPIVPAPAPTYNGSGAVAFTPTFPAGVTEEYIQVADLGPAGSANAGMGCNGAGGSGGIVYYTLVVKPTTTLPVSITNANAPKGTTGAICTAAENTATTSTVTVGDSFVVQVIGFDYDAYAASYPASLKNPSPTVPAQVDVSVGVPVTNVSP